MKIYIAGPITGVPNFEKPFNEMQKLLEAEGHVVLNPTILPKGLEWEEYMPICFAMISPCDAIHMLDGWKNSKGARLEHEYAIQEGKKIR